MEVRWRRFSTNVQIFGVSVRFIGADDVLYVSGSLHGALGLLGPSDSHCTVQLGIP